MSRTIAFLFVSLLIVVFCAIGQDVQDKISDQEYTVYNDVFSASDAPKYFVFQSLTGVGPDDEPLDKEVVEYIQKKVAVPLDQAILGDLIAKNAKKYALENKFSPELKVKFIADSEEEKIFSGANGWEDFRKIYGSVGITELSRVGFSADKTKALFYTGSQADWLVGSGFYLILEKKDGKWIVVDSVMAWIS